MEKGYIYSITNKVNGKAYVGQTQFYELRKRKAGEGGCHSTKKKQTMQLSLFPV